jgi:transcriptional regulator with XRE-family HTH domain
MPDRFGARLRQQREARGVSLASIADDSKIKASLLEALERDDVSRWPTGIFRRGYFRAYAAAIGLDVEVAVREFMATHPDPSEAESTSDPESRTTATDSTPPTRIRMLLDAAVGAIARRRRNEAPGPPISEVQEPRVPMEPVAALANGPSAVPEGVDVAPEPDLPAVSRLCTAFGRVESADQMAPLLAEAAGLLGARGLVVWLLDEPAGRLTPTLSHGYSRKVLGRLPAVDRGADNPTAESFRSGETVRVCDETTGALVVPLIGPVGCVGVLALELPRGFEHSPTIEAVAVIVASMLAPMVAGHTSTPQRRRAPEPVAMKLPGARTRGRVASASYR